MGEGVVDMKRIICILLAAALLISAFSGCSFEKIVPNEIRAAILYSEGENWKDTLYALEQSPMLGLSVEAKRICDVRSFSDWDILYLDESILNDPQEGLVETICDFTRTGGAVFLPNGFTEYFPYDYLGISGIEKLPGYCPEPEYPACGEDLGSLQQIIRDYSDLYKRYKDFDYLSQQDYGYGVISDTASPLVLWNGVAVYTLNCYGDGYVFLSNPMLPSTYSAGSLTMEPKDGQSNYASTTSSFNQLVLCGFAEYVAKQTDGYALERVYGYFGTPSMAWELHYEEITGIANDSLQIFSDLCYEYDQIPSYTLIRNSYTWFLRAESVTFLLNQGEAGFDFQMDLNESAYSSGTHIDAGGQWLTLGSVENGGSYFADYPEYDHRAYPQAVDLNGDQLTDILCGGADGMIHFFEGTGFSGGRLHTKAPVVLTDANGAPICFGDFSAPHSADVNEDGFLDLVCGWADGKVRWLSGDGSLSFAYRDVLYDAGVAEQALPAVADADGDGAADLIVGSDSGKLTIFPGLDASGAVDLSGLCAEAELGSWLAPTVTDWDGDGNPDLAVGVFHGYIALLLGNGDGSYHFSGYISADEMNYKGNHHLKFGNWAVPSFADLDGDGRDDLLCGSQEYGIAYPIDSEYFPYRQKLQEQVDYAREHELYMGVHFYTNDYASAERERYELQAHKAAMEAYGMDTSRLGANQHTWHTSSLSGSQTMHSIAGVGLLWQSGFAAPGSLAIDPQSAAENVVALPFFLMKDGEPGILVQNNAVLLYMGDEDNAISARYRMPICVFYHCDFVYRMEEHARNALNTVQAFREMYGYNFNREDQLIEASACALNQQVKAQGGLADKNRITIAPAAQEAASALYSEAVSQSLGVRVVFSEQVDTENIRTDADIWYWDGRDLILGLNRAVTICVDSAKSDDVHLRRINMAADITMTDEGAQIHFLSGGMMEAAVEGEATTDSPGWTVTYRNNETIFTKFGSEESLNLIFTGG